MFSVDRHRLSNGASALHGFENRVQLGSFLTCVWSYDPCYSGQRLVQVTRSCLISSHARFVADFDCPSFQSILADMAVPKCGASLMRRTSFSSGLMSRQLSLKLKPQSETFPKSRLKKSLRMLTRRP